MPLVIRWIFFRGGEESNRAPKGQSARGVKKDVVRSRNEIGFPIAGKEFREGKKRRGFLMKSEKLDLVPQAASNYSQEKIQTRACEGEGELEGEGKKDRVLAYPARTKERRYTA